MSGETVEGVEQLPTWLRARYRSRRHLAALVEIDRALRDVGGIIDKDHRPQALIVVPRYVADETRCIVAHDRPPGPFGRSITQLQGPATVFMINGGA